MLESIRVTLVKESTMNDSLVYEEDGIPTKEDSRSSSPSKRNRIFDDKSRNQCWQKADVVAGRHPERWRKDVAGNIVCRKLTRCEGCLCYEYDHIRPFSKEKPCVIYGEKFKQLCMGICFPCWKLKMTVRSDDCLSLPPICSGGPGGETDAKNCQILQSRVNRFKSNRSDLGSDDLKQYSCDLKFTDKELDVIEMAVYGNVVRPGLQCKCKSVAENLGNALYKQKGPEVSSCQLPYTSTS